MSDRNSCRASRTDAAAVSLALILPTLITWVYFVWLADAASWLQQSTYGLGKVVQFALPVVWVLAFQRAWPKLTRAWPKLTRAWPGLTKPARRGIVEGAAFGVVVFGAIVLLYHGWLKPAGLLAEADEAVHGKLAGFNISSVARYVALGAFYSVVHSFLEEYYWRWFVFGQLCRLVTLPVAIAVSSLGFMGHHVLVLSIYFGWFSAPAILFSLAVAIGGAAWAWIYHRGGSLLGVWVSHLLIDAAIFVVGYDMARHLLGS